MRRVQIHITGIVQGVGFRPFVYREAVARGLTGWVLNAGDGVHVEAEGEDATVAAFVRALSDEAPAAARVERVHVTDLAPTGGERAFRIVASDGASARTTLVSPDIATCPDCLRELFDPADRRYHYPFINCTNCGPRYTIIRALPYDRAQTSMDAFPMCPSCAAEYADPLDRRFHAQPNACFACGPHLTWRERDDEAAAVGCTLTESDAIIERCAAALAAGGIVAIKGLGGFHLACNAADEHAVAELRQRKRRSNNPLAVMVRDLEGARSLCKVGPAEQELLEGTIRPIVLLRRRGEDNQPAPLASSVAFDLPELGVMLPYTPLQHLLLAACAEHGINALVMTSGNLSEEPIETDDALAWQHLVETGIADALLGNDRAILSRFDDSVVRVIDGVVRPVRRARGYAPRPVELPPGKEEGLRASDVILACGPEQKATVALTREQPDGSALCLLSPHIGDLENASTFDAWHAARARLEALFDLQPAALACDLHAGYLSSQWARAEAAERGLPLVEVQHHHAHIAAVLAEAIARGEIGATEPVIGLALDGTGAGTDGTIWGGEILVATLAGYERAGHLAPWLLPGGAASVRDARRNALSLLHACGLLEHPEAKPLVEGLSAAEKNVTLAMVEQGINRPATSSMGRFLDALAALTGICPRATYEGEPAIALEAAAWRAPCDAEGEPQHRLAIRWQAPDDPDPRTAEQQARVGEHPAAIELVLDPAPLVTAVLDDMRDQIDPRVIACNVHQGLAQSLAEAACAVASERKCTAVALSGGVFLNRMLLSQVSQLVSARGLRALVSQELPVNDGCIAYGQAAIARTRRQQL